MSVRAYVLCFKILNRYWYYCKWEFKVFEYISCLRLVLTRVDIVDFVISNCQLVYQLVTTHKHDNDSNTERRQHQINSNDSFAFIGSDDYFFCVHDFRFPLHDVTIFCSVYTTHILLNFHSLWQIYTEKGANKKKTADFHIWKEQQKKSLS